VLLGLHHRVIFEIHHQFSKSAVGETTLGKRNTRN
jgi:hypothetical protein